MSKSHPTDQRESRAAAATTSDNPKSTERRLSGGRQSIVLCGRFSSTSTWLATALAESFHVRQEPALGAVVDYIEDEESSLILVDTPLDSFARVEALLRQLQPEAAHRVVLAVWVTLVDHIRALARIGVADFVRLPCEVDDLILRLDAAARRNRAVRDLVIGRRLFDPTVTRAHLRAAGCLLSERERLLFVALSKDFGNPISRRELRSQVWGDCQPLAGHSNVVDVYICYLRKKLERGGAGLTIQTLPGAYVLQRSEGKKTVGPVEETVGQSASQVGGSTGKPLRRLHAI
jgi:DNA-binding response OmpR family regulator